MPSFLFEDVRIQQWIKDRIQVNIDKVIEIFMILACNRIASLVRISESVQKGLQRPLKELHKGLFYRVFSGATKYTVLKDVGNTGGVMGRSSKSDSKDLVFIVIYQGEELGPGLDMSIKACLCPVLLDFLLFYEFEAMGRAHTFYLTSFLKGQI